MSSSLLESLCCKFWRFSRHYKFSAILLPFSWIIYQTFCETSPSLSMSQVPISHLLFLFLLVPPLVYAPTSFRSLLFTSLKRHFTEFVHCFVRSECVSTRTVQVVYYSQCCSQTTYSIFVCINTLAMYLYLYLLKLWFPFVKFLDFKSCQLFYVF